MHEQSLMNDLMNKINSISKLQNNKKIVCVKIKLGALSHISAEHFREHFVISSKGSSAENAQLDIEEMINPDDPNAQEIILESVEVED